MSKHICLSFGDPQTQYCLDCDQLVECCREMENKAYTHMTEQIKRLNKNIHKSEDKAER